MNNKINQLVKHINEELILFLSIGFGMFLFVLFFQPFPINTFDFNNSLLFFAGFGVIVFLMMILVRVGLPWLNPNKQPLVDESFFPSYLSGFIILTLCTVALSFYLRYVGQVSLSFYSIFKIFVMCIVPPIVLRFYDEITELRKMNAQLLMDKKHIQERIEKYAEDNLNQPITFLSENSTENLTLLIADIVFIKSADNYAEFAYLGGGDFKKKLIRITLKNVEQQLRPYTNFIRCHRICIVNSRFIEKLNKDYHNHWLTIRGFAEEIPVSRQYLLKLKELQ